MIRFLFISLLMVFSLSSIKAQQISPTDIIQDKVVLYLPNATKGQLDNLKLEFENFRQIKKAVYVPGIHHCLLMEVKPDDSMKFFSDAMKIVTMHIPASEIILKTPAAYNEINGKGNDGSFVIIK